MRSPEPAFPAFARFRRAPFWWHATLWLALGFIGWLLTAPEKTREMRLFSIGFLSLLNFAVAWAFVGATRRESLRAGVRRALAFIAAGMVAVGLGGAYLLVEVARSSNYQSIFSPADALFLLNYPLVLLGFAQLPRGERPVASRWRIAVDGAALVSGVGVPLWLGAVSPAFKDATGLNAALELVWPGVSFLGLVGLNAALLTRAPLPTRGALWFLLAGIGVSWLADLLFSLDASALVIRHSAIHWTNLINAVSLCLYLAAAWRFQSDPLPVRPKLRPVAFSPVPMATILIVAGWLIALSMIKPSDPQMLHRILPGLILLLVVLLVREVLVLGDTVRWMEVEFQRESQVRVEAMVRHSSDVLMVVDAQYHIQFASPSLTAVLGRPVDQIIGQSLLQFAHPEDVAAGARFLDGLLRTPSVESTLQWRLRHEDGTFRHLETAGSNALGEPAIAGLVLNSRDVTDRTQLEEELRESRKLEAISRLVGGIAHNFNNLLASTFLRLDLLRMDELLPPALRGEIADLQHGAKRTADLVDQLMSVGQVQFLRLKRMDLAATLGDLRPVLDRLVGEHIRLQIADAARPAWIEADGGLIDEVILSLCANARDAMPQGGRLAIEISPVEPGAEEDFPGGGVCLSFHDTGHGMDESVRRRLFEPFFTTKEVGQGLGLGLASVHGIVKQHRGRLSVESEVGRGSTFRVYLPAATDLAAA